MDDQHTTHDMSHVDNPEVAHETRDINVRIVVGFGLALVVAAILIHLLIWVLFDFFGHLQIAAFPQESGQVQTQQVQPSEIRLPPSPRLQDKPREDLKNLRKQEDDLLNSYSWINQQTGAVRIPIWQAMNQVMQQGFPVSDQPQAAEAVMPDSSSSGRTAEPAIKR